MLILWSALLLAATHHFAPAAVLGGRHGQYATSSAIVAVLVVAAWVIGALAAGGWRTKTMDA